MVNEYTTSAIIASIISSAKFIFSYRFIEKSYLILSSWNITWEHWMIYDSYVFEIKVKLTFKLCL